MNFTKSKWRCASLEFVGMVVDRQDGRPVESKLAAVAELSLPTTVEELRAFLGITGSVSYTHLTLPTIYSV